MPKKAPRKKTARTESPAPNPPALTIEAALAAAQASGRSMVAVWHVSGGKVHLHRTTDRFPRGDLGTALQLLANDLANEAGPPASMSQEMSAG